MSRTLLAAGLVPATCGTAAAQEPEPDEARKNLAAHCMPVDDGTGRARPLEPSDAAMCTGWLAWEVYTLRGQLELMEQRACFVELVLCTRLEGLCDEGAKGWSSTCRARP
jgi:hypothetical protein